MAIGTTAAIIGSAVIGAGASYLSGKSASKAAGKAADAQAQGTAAAAQVQKDIYNQNVGFQTPLYNTGIGAMNQINALLGIQVPQAAQQAQAQAGTGAYQSEDQWAQSALDALRAEVNPSLWARVNGIADPSDRLAALEPMMFRRDREVYGQFTAGNPRPMASQGMQQDGQPIPANQVTQPSAQAAYDTFKNYTGYQSRLTEANNAMNSQYAARGTLQSGAATQALARMNQDYASNEFGNYVGYLGGQQQLAAGAANALSGVGTNYANAAGNIALANGQNQADAALRKGNAQIGAIQGIGSSFGSALGYFGRQPSDRRLKKDIVELGIRPDGLMAFEWTYRHDPEAARYRGVMADEVKIKRPEAYIENYRDGYAGVNYAALGTPMVKVAA